MELYILTKRFHYKKQKVSLWWSSNLEDLLTVRLCGGCRWIWNGVGLRQGLIDGWIISRAPQVLLQPLVVHLLDGQWTKILNFLVKNYLSDVNRRSGPCKFGWLSSSIPIFEFTTSIKGWANVFWNIDILRLKWTQCFS